MAKFLIDKTRSETCEVPRYWKQTEQFELPASTHHYSGKILEKIEALSIRPFFIMYPPSVLHLFPENDVNSKTNLVPYFLVPLSFHQMTIAHLRPEKFSILVNLFPFTLLKG